MKELENKLNKMLVTDAPFQLPEDARKWIAEYAWVFAVAGLVIGLAFFFPLLAGLGVVSSFGVTYGSGRLFVAAWLALLAMLGYLIVLAVAIPKLKNKQARGWDLMYYSTLAFFIYSVVNTLSYINAGTLFSLLLNLAGLFVGLYVLFQVRSKFKGGATAPKAPAKKK
jgi:hypothetical protein